jgi:type II secretory pathway component GspD/PulD (secretin)
MPQRMNLTLNQNRITVHADQVKLQTLMNDLAEKTDIKVHIDPDLNPKISADFTNHDLQRGLESILNPWNHVLKWESAPTPNGSRIRLTAIYIFKPGNTDSIIHPEKTSNLDIARNPENGFLYVKGEILIRLKPDIDFEQVNRILRHLGGDTDLSESNARHLPDKIA